ncbi:keratin, type I cytoskeletal 9-like [Uranotaenia lowii]|uniref:keratin, type I cytoskeletal 9-like n=1 Tax=Uranotaenia lowii TaxID=190385 RepID=UPI002478C68D|nr:keratin, type I cytoskeletal 9-like [Uranotaenia lowii]
MIAPPHLAATLNNSGGGSGSNNNNTGNTASKSINSGLSAPGVGGAAGLGSHLGVGIAGGAAISSSGGSAVVVSGSQDSLSGFVLSGGSGGGGGGGNGNGSGSSGSGSSRTCSSNGSGNRILAVNRNIDDLLFGSDLDSLINDNIINGFKSLKVAKSQSQDNLDYQRQHQQLQQQQYTTTHRQPFYHHYHSHQLHSLPPIHQQLQQQTPTSLHYQSHNHHLQQQQQQQQPYQLDRLLESGAIITDRMLTDKAKQKQLHESL